MEAASFRWQREHLCRFSPATQELYIRVCREFLAFCPANVSELREEHIEKYLYHVLARSSGSTANTYLAVIKSLCKHIARQYGLPNVAANIDRFNADPPNSRFLTEEEYAAVLAACSPFEKDIVQFIGNTGLRSAEFLSLTWGNIDYALQSLWVVGKGKKRRTIPLNATVKAILGKYPRLPNSSRIQLLKSTYSKSLYRLCRRLAVKAGIPRFGPHSLRHRFSTALYHRGVSLLIISRILGHANITVTEKVYVHLLSEDFRGATNCLDV